MKLTQMAPPSPIYTPAILHTHMPPWAQQTPSPSPVIRCPDIARDGGNESPAEFNRNPSLISQEMLWAVCAPFLDQMLAALQHAVEAQVLQAMQSGDNAKQAEAAQRKGPLGKPVLKKQGSNPFNSLFDPAPSFEEGPDGASASGEDDKGSPEAPESVARSTPAAPESASFASFSPASSLGTSKAQEASNAASVAAAGIGLQMRAYPAPGAASVAAQIAGQFQQQQLIGGFGFGGGCGFPGYGPEVGDVRMPMSAVMGAGAGDAEEKSVMVCRHWKSKGWCRMEAGCKFLHPEHKRGSGPAPKPPESGGGGAGTNASPEGEKAITKSSKRSGRRRQGPASAPGTGSAPPTAATFLLAPALAGHNIQHQ